MSTFFLLTVLVFGAEPGTAKASSIRNCEDAAKVGDVEVRRLVEQLGGDSFAAREAASKTLATIGERALPALNVAKTSPDVEVRRRAAGLVMKIQQEEWRRRVEDILKSKLSAYEKGRQLKSFITKGMTSQRVETVLGQGFPGPAFFSLHSGGEGLYYYAHAGLQIWFYTPPDNSSTTVSSVELMDPKKVEALEAFFKSAEKR